MTTIGILGAGKLGTVLARLAVTAGYRTLVAASGDPDEIALLLEVMAPGATPSWGADTAREADIVILALPLSKFHSVERKQLAGKIVIDAMNYWPPVDGTMPEFENGDASSIIVASAVPESRVVRALSHLGYHQLDEDAQPPGSQDRHAMAIAGDDADAVEQVAGLVDRLGFDPVLTGDLAASASFGPGTDLFGTSTSRHEVTRRLRRNEVTASA
jgi:8-hydroxy-5-deazaflavin:NADPH oxidoreductase